MGDLYKDMCEVSMNASVKINVNFNRCLKFSPVKCALNGGWAIEEAGKAYKILYCDEVMTK